MNDETRSSLKRNALLEDVIEVTAAQLEEHEVPPAGCARTGRPAIGLLGRPGHRVPA